MRYRTWAREDGGAKHRLRLQNISGSGSGEGPNWHTSQMCMQARRSLTFSSKHPTLVPVGLAVCSTAMAWNWMPAGVMMVIGTLVVVVMLLLMVMVW